MIQRLSRRVIRDSSVAIVVYFDNQIVPITPDSVNWSLFDKDGNTINNRRNVLLVPGATVVVLLQKEDLALPDPYESQDRYLLVEGEYFSLVGRVPFKAEAVFEVSDLVLESGV